MSISTIIFDLDGTLLYTLEDIMDSVNFALQAQNLPLRTIDEIRNFVGNGIQLLIERAVPNNTNQQTIKKSLCLFKEHYAKNMFNKTKPYENIIKVLQTLKSNEYNLAVISNKHDDAVRKLVNKYFSNLFDIIIGQSNSVKPKPSIDGINMVFKELKVTPEECILIGDSEVDIQTANNAGMPCLSVTWGYKNINFLYKNGASTLLFTPEEILELL